MNIAGEFAGSGSVKNWLHKALNTQKGATSGSFLIILEKRLSGKTFQRPSLISEHFNLCIYLYIILYLNEREKKGKVQFSRYVESDIRDDKNWNCRMQNTTRELMNQREASE